MQKFYTPWYTSYLLPNVFFLTFFQFFKMFFVIRLNRSELDGERAPTTDPHETLQYSPLTGLNSFLTMARQKHFEFSSLRRAKWSTMAMLIELHESCKIAFTLQDFDLNIPSSTLTGHEHKMNKVGLAIDDGMIGVTGSHNTRINVTSPQTVQPNQGIPGTERV